MSRSFSFHPEAEAELREAVRYYEKEAAGLGVEFAAHVRLAVDQLLENPLTAAPAEVDARRKLLRRFPYALIFTTEGPAEDITIIAVMHQRRKPGYWRARRGSKG